MYFPSPQYLISCRLRNPPLNYFGHDRDIGFPQKFISTYHHSYHICHSTLILFTKYLKKNSGNILNLNLQVGTRDEWIFVFEYFGYHQQQCATVPGGVGMLCQFLPKSRRQKSDKQPSVLAYASTLMLQQLLKGFCALFFERHPDLFILTQDYYLLDAIPVASALIILYLQHH